MISNKASLELTPIRVAILRTVLVSVVFAAVYTAASLLFIKRYPLVEQDEPWFAEPAEEFAAGNGFAWRSFSLTEHGGPEKAILLGKGYLLSLAASFYSFGYTPFAARIVSLFFVLAAAAAVASAARDLYNTKAGLIAALVFLASEHVLFTSHHARPEGMGVFLSALAFAAVVRGIRTGQTGWFLLAGASAGFGLEVHPNVLAAYVPCAFVLFASERLRTFRSQRFWAMTAACAAGVAFFVFTRWPGEAELLRAQLAEYAASREYSHPVLYGPLIEVKRFFAFFWEARYHRHMFDAAFFTAALLYCGLRRSPGDRDVLIGFGGMLVGFIILVSSKSAYYMVYYYPFFAIAAGAAVSGLTILPGRRILRAATGYVLLAIFLTGCAAQWGYLAHRYKDADYNAYTEKLGAAIPEDAIILAREEILFGFEGRRIIGLNAFNRARAGTRVPPRTVADIVREENISYIIYDDLWREVVEEGLDVAPYYDRAELKKFLAERTEVVEVITDRFYGSSNRHTDNEIRILRVVKIALNR